MTCLLLVDMFRGKKEELKATFCYISEPIGKSHVFCEALLHLLVDTLNHCLKF